MWQYGALSTPAAAEHPRCISVDCQVLQKRLATSDIVLDGKSRDYNLIDNIPSHD